MGHLSFIHAADLHLDSPFKGLSTIPESIFHQVKESTFEALDRLVQAAIAKQVDFVLLAGDVFDNEKQSLKAQVRLRNAFEQLQHYHIKVYMSHGNHDFTAGNSNPITYPDNVVVFPDETVTHVTYKKNDETLAAIYGFSYKNRAVTSNKAKEFVPVSGGVPYHIAMLHGSVDGNKEHDVYAPFHISDLTDKDMDYWALGHIHQKEILKENPAIVYPGNIQGRNSKESGQKGCYHVELSEKGAILTFLPLQSMEFKKQSVDISSCDEPHQLERILLEAIDRTDKTCPELVHLTLNGVRTHLRKWEETAEEVVQLVNEVLMHRTNWTYIYRCQLTAVEKESFHSLKQSGHFAGELLKYVDKASIQPYLDELYRHRQAKKYVQAMSSEQEKRVKDKAKQLLIDELLYQEGD
ncbi:DNA repair exonuclease [Lentibacillus halophilus]|uniref:DNA repair exonuclease n=1 Tax=Lentibacillus halophilus TaxID=295065 RepID=A0ABP3J2B0_9BACI